MGVVIKTERKHTLTLNLSDRENAGLERLAAKADISKSALLRQALRLYDMIQARIAAGETMHFSGDRERVAMFIGPGFDNEGARTDG